MSKKFIVIVFLIALLAGSFVITDALCGYYETVIDIMVIGDEEFQFEFPHGWERYLGWGIYFEWVFARFSEQCDITFRLCGWWDTWDSTDGESNLWNLHQEALQETGFAEYAYWAEFDMWMWRFVPQWIDIPNFGGHYIDMVVILTGQQPLDGVGFSPPFCKAFIFEAWYTSVPKGQGLMHEFGHQFWCRHCSDKSCVMYTPGLFEVFPSEFCATHNQQVLDNWDRFWRYVGGGCPILSVWDGSCYFEEGLLDIHNAEGFDVTYQHTLTIDPEPVNNKLLLRLVEHPQTHSYIDQVKLYATLEDGTTVELPLIWARHSEYGNVLPQLLFNDEWKTDILGTEQNDGTSQSIDLKFVVSLNLEIASFTFQIEGHNRITKK